MRKLNFKKICGGVIILFIILVIIGAMTGGGSSDSAPANNQSTAPANDPTNELVDDNTNGIKVEDGKLINTADEEEIGTVKKINSVDDGEKEIYDIDPEAIKKYVSDDPLVTEYIVASDDTSKEGIYWMFGHDGEIFLAFTPTEKMENGMLSRMTEFCKTQGILP